MTIELISGGAISLRGADNYDSLRGEGLDFLVVDEVTYYVLFFLHLKTRRVSLAGITRHPTEEWMRQMGRNAIDETSGYLRQQRYVLHDRDTKFCEEFREKLAAGGVKCLRLPARSPNLNAFAERWVRSVKEECLSKLILFGEGSLRRALSHFQEHYLSERNHQGKGIILLFPSLDELPNDRISRANRWSSQVLLPGGRMSFLAIRAHRTTALS